MKPLVNLYKLGRLPYVKALNVQQVLFDKLKQDVTSIGIYRGANDVKPTTNCSVDFKKDYTSFHQSGIPRNSLILVEHEPVYTIGIRSNEYNDKYVTRLKRELNDHKLEADFVKTNRGGLITFHGPGQLVVYPIIHLGDFTKSIKNRSVKYYVNKLESTIIDTLAMIGLHGAHTVREYPGVWLDGGERKIAFIGISCKRFVTMHGISINCDCDLSWFDHIVSCGIEDKSITSIRQELLLARQKAGASSRSISGTLPECFTMDRVHAHTTNQFSSGNHDEIVASRLDQGDGGSFSDDVIRAKSNVEHISEAFCASFTRHFDCQLIVDRGLKSSVGLEN